MDPQLAADEYTGRKLGKYELACRLSTGGMSEIFLAYGRGVAGFRKYVVLKRILSDIRGDEEFVRMFVQEAKITAGFAHSHIAQVFDLDVAEGELFLAMEFVPGATLVELVQACLSSAEPIPIGFSAAVARDVALALHYAHTFIDPAGREQPVIHRDVAEKNIMVSYDGVTKLLDFGIAKRLDRTDLTQIGTVKGTAGYMSPEQIRGEKLDARSDVFSLGVVLHECLVGQRLFYRKNREEEMVAALTHEVAPPSKVNPQVPAALEAVVMRALHKDRDQRFNNARELARAIERAIPELLWEPEQAGALVRRHFGPRREQTRRLLSGPASPASPSSEEVSEVRFAQRQVPLPPPVSTRSERPLPPVAARDEEEEEEEDVTRTVALPRESPSRPAATDSLALTLPDGGSFAALEEAHRREGRRTRKAALEEPAQERERGPRGRTLVLPASESPPTVLVDETTEPPLPVRSRRPRDETDPGEEQRTSVDLKRASTPAVAVAIGVGVGLAVVGLLYLLWW